jgi:sulfite reductase (NADPH) flavoprotein alpha-component
MLDVLAEFPSLVNLGLEFLNWMSPLAPRYYSIASAPNGVGLSGYLSGSVTQEINLIYKLVQFTPAVSSLTAPRQHFGVATRCLSLLSVGDVVQADVKPNRNFKLPSNERLPIIMIGAGTGIAPFIGFMQQRVAQMSHLTMQDVKFEDDQAWLNASHNVLFWGEASAQTHCLKCHDLRTWEAAGQLQWFAAFSRDQAHKVYVQDCLWQQRALVWQQWQKGAVVYVCGAQATMAKAVEQTWSAIMQSLGGLSQAQADQAWLDAKAQKRIQLDVY